MFDKYEVRSYPNYFQMEYLDTDTEKFNTTYKKVKNNYKISDNNFQKGYILSKEKDNISIYQSDSKNTYKKIQYQNINKDIKPAFRYTNRRKTSIPSQNYVEQKFSYNYINRDNEQTNKNTNRNNNSLNKGIYLDNNLNKSNNQIPKRTINSINNQFNIEKSDNFKVLSYKPEDYESDNKEKSKIIQIFKKQDDEEKNFNLDKIVPSPSSSSINSSKKQQQLHSYKAPTLKFQSFFGSFTKPIHTKNKSQTKSNSKLKKNHLEDFNIDKLIEIGDSYENNNMKNIMSFGQRITSIKNKMKNKRLINNINNENMQKSYDKIRKDINKVMQEQKRGNENENINDNMITSTKKIVYHGQIKRKR